MLTIADPVNPQTTVNSLSAATYMLAYESGAAGCEASDTAVITFHTTPTISQVIEVCSNDLMSYAVSFQVSGGQSPYLVNGMPMASNPFVSGQFPAGTSYSFQAEDSNGCLSATISGDQSCDCASGAGMMDTTTITRCIGDSLIALLPSGFVTGPGDTLAFILHDGQIPGGIIAWSFDPAFPYTPAIQAGQHYYISAVTGVKDSNGFPDASDPCFSWSAGTPFAFYNPPAIVLEDTETIGCDPQRVLLDIGGSAAGPDYLYYWTTSDGGLILGAADAPSIEAGSAGTYHLTIAHPLSGCRSSGQIIVNADRVDLDQLVLDIQPPSCAGDCNGQLMIIQSGPNWLFDFGDGVFTNSILPDANCPGSYALIVKNESGCLADTSYTIPDVSALSVDLGPDLTINPGESLQLQASSQGDIVAYNWHEADTCTGCTSITIHPEVTTTYEIEVIDDHGCTATDQVVVTVRVSKDIFLPNVFSPNGDGVNDELYIPQHRSLSAIQRFEILDRWGTLVFRATDQVPGSQGTKWNGTFHSTAMNPGVYTCVAEIQFEDGSTQQVVWDATLIR